MNDRDEPENNFGNDVLFKKNTAKISFALFLQLPMDGIKVSNDSTSSVLTLARADAWITTNLVMMSVRKVEMDQNELSGVAAFKYLFRTFCRQSRVGSYDAGEKTDRETLLQ